jgi:PST family polysaccharide transporter
VNEPIERAKSQGIWLAGGQAAARAAQFLSTIALARLLVPEHFGKVALAAVVWEVVALFGNTGVAATLVHRRDEEDLEALRDAAFRVNALVTTAVAAAAIAIGWGAARFYAEPSMVPIMALYAASFVIGAAGTVHSALLTREMAFGRLALVETTAAVASAALSVLLAWIGFGFWSLVAHAPAIALLRVVLLWRLHPWRPRLRGGARRWREITSYGRWVLGADLAGYVCLNGDYMITGKVLGEGALGVYSMAYRMANWPVEAGVWMVSRVAFPALAGLQSEPERLARVFVKMLRVVAGLSFPAVAILFATAPDLIAVLYGSERWGGAATPIRILLPYVLVRAVGSPASQVLLATGRARTSFVFAASLTPVLLLAVWAGSSSGITGVAIATAAVLGAGATILLAISCRAARVPVRDLLGALAPGSTAAAGALAASAAALQAPLAAGQRLGLSLAAGAIAAWAIGRALFPEDHRLVIGSLGTGSLRQRWTRMKGGVTAVLAPSARRDP